MNNMELETDIEALEMEMGDITIHYCPVIPNPEGEPTAELKTADIEGTIYEIVDEEARTELENKVDKVDGKDLSTNDYTDEDKAIVDGVTTALDGKVDKDGDKVLSDNNYSDEDKAIVDGVTSALNDKADKSDTYTKTETDSFLSAKANTSDLSTVATSGDYNDLENKPNLSTVATSGSYDDLTDKPTIDTAISPTSTNAVQNKAIYNLLNDLLPEAEETGNPISISNASGFNAKALTVDMLPIQAGSGTPSPSNPRPISGRTQTEIEVNGETTTISFGQTVYGGEVDVTSGGTINKMAIVDLADLTWTMNTLDRWNTTGLRNLIKKPSGLSEKADIVAEQYKTVSSNDLSGDTTLIGIECNIYGDVKVRNGSTTESPKGKIAYAVATPTTINTPATPISLNKGNNTLSTSGDNMDLKYSTTISNPTSLTMARPTLSLSSPTVAEPTVEEPTEE